MRSKKTKIRKNELSIARNLCFFFSRRVRPFIPTSKEIDANAVLDRDEKKLDVYLGLHKGSLMVSTLYVFLPFTISLDPQLRKDITEQYQPIEQIFKMNPPNVTASTSAAPPPPPVPLNQALFNSNLNVQPLRLRNSGRFTLPQPAVNPYAGQFFPAMGYNGNSGWGMNGNAPGFSPYQNMIPVGPPMENVNVDSALVVSVLCLRLLIHI